MRVPYKQLRQAEADALKQFPQAHHVHALWTPASNASEIQVEVWSEPHRASVHAWTPAR